VLGSNEAGAFVAGLLASQTQATKIVGAAKQASSSSSSSSAADAASFSRMISSFRPLQHMFSALSYTTIGMLINAEALWPRLLFLCALVLLVYAVKFSLAACTAHLFRYAGSTSVKVGVGMAQVSEMAFVLASQGVNAGLLTQPIYDFVVGIVIASIALSYVMPHALNYGYAAAFGSGRRQRRSNNNPFSLACNTSGGAASSSSSSSSASCLCCIAAAAAAAAADATTATDAKTSMVAVEEEEAAAAAAAAV
jgi:Kef-type K+ transport system membrane component KefB